MARIPSRIPGPTTIVAAMMDIVMTEESVNLTRRRRRASRTTVENDPSTFGSTTAAFRSPPSRMRRSRRILVHLLPKHLGEAMPRPMQMHLHGAVRDAEDLSDLGDRTILDVEEQYACTLLQRELSK